MGDPKHRVITSSRDQFRIGAVSLVLISVAAIIRRDKSFAMFVEDIGRPLRAYLTTPNVI